MPFDETYEQKFHALVARLDSDPDAAASFADNPLPHLEGAAYLSSRRSFRTSHIPTTSQIWAMPTDVTTAQPGKEARSNAVKVTKHWCGIDIALDEALTNWLGQGMQLKAITAALGPPL